MAMSKKFTVRMKTTKVISKLNGRKEINKGDYNLIQITPLQITLLQTP